MVEHLLCGVWHEIATNLEDNRAATTLTAIDYAKAFNRLCHKSCLQALAAKGASSLTIRLVATFLTNRTMQLNVGQEWFKPLPVTGGSRKVPWLAYFCSTLPQTIWRVGQESMIVSPC